MKLTFYNESMEILLSSYRSTTTIFIGTLGKYSFLSSNLETNIHLNLNSDRIVPPFDPEDQFTPISEAFTTVEAGLRDFWQRSHARKENFRFQSHRINRPAPTQPIKPSRLWRINVEKNIHSSHALLRSPTGFDTAYRIDTPSTKI